MHCVAILGGSFDPIHEGHLALARCFHTLLQPDEFWFLPAGAPWQKNGLHVSDEHRLEMIRLALLDLPWPALIDRREIERSQSTQQPTYTVDTLREIRAELGRDTSIVFLMGADQLHRIHTWHQWRHLFDYAHIGVGSRPGYALEMTHIPEGVKEECTQRNVPHPYLRQSTQGLFCITQNVAADVSATDIRAFLGDGEKRSALIPPKVLDYAAQNKLYQN